jgi:predicted amidohydrolase YtcJ
MIDRDLFRIPPHEIREAKVVATLVGGKVVSGGWPAQQVRR